MQHKAAEKAIKRMDASDKLSEAVKVARVLDLVKEAQTTLHSSMIMHNFAGSEISSFDSIRIQLSLLHKSLTE